jgi:hypothetical protein
MWGISHSNYQARINVCRIFVFSNSLLHLFLIFRASFFGVAQCGFLDFS